MSIRRASDRILLAALWLGVAVPFLYYGIQVAAAPFFPGFSVVGNTASELGSNLSQHPSLFNSGIFVQGAVTIIVAVGFLVALLRIGTHPVLAWITASAVALAGVGTLWAGIFPMPDPKHSGHPVFLIGTLLVPVALTVVLWKRSRSWLLKGYFIATLLLLLAMVPIMSGASGLDTHAYRGLTQRVFALTIFPPIGVASFVLVRRLREPAL